MIDTKRQPPLVALFLVAACAGRGATTVDPESGPSPGGSGAERRHVPGLVPLSWDAGESRLLLESPPLDTPLLYYVSLPGGLGSNDVGLDRGQIGERRLVEFRSVGGKLLLVAPNMGWRSPDAPPSVRDGVRDSFAESVLWGFETVDDTDGRLLFDATAFFLRDAHGIERALADAGQGSFRLEPSRSAVLESRLAGFPENTEVEVLLTLSSERPGREVRRTAADPRSVSLRVRHSFVALPDLAEHGHKPRRFDPRSGFFPHVWRDPSRGLDQELEVRVLPRHHLCQEHPIVYHVDRAAPEPVRTALLEGARYWEPVFAAAGFPGGFEVELLPEGADLLDARYNVIEWVNRSTRGWSYGDAVVDPRTGEILKGHVSLGALRVRQDVLLFEGLLSPYAEGGAGADAARVRAAALARIRQLSAHEVGHTLGLAHNFAASTNGRASVMDYPAPRVRIDGTGELDLSDAYREGCGEWDELAIRFGYAELGTGAQEARGLAEVLAEMRRQGLSYLSDFDARGVDRAHPLANLWDDGADPVAELETTYAVRRAGLERFSRAALRPDRPLSELERPLVPLYLHHRYQLEAALKSLGGRTYAYTVAGDSEAPELAPVAPDTQRRALVLALHSLDAEFLRLPERLRAQLPPPPPGYGRGRESFVSGSLLVDPLAPARASVTLTLDLLLDPERASRLADQARLDPEQPSFEELLDALVQHVLGGSFDDALLPEDPAELALVVEVRALFFERLFDLAADPDLEPGIQAAVLARLRDLRDVWPGMPPPFPASLREGEELRRFFEEPRSERRALPRPVLPPGSPIGCGKGRSPR